MKKITVFFIIVLITYISINQANAQLNLPNVFSDNMVLQRETNVNIWGNSIAGSDVQIITSWNKDTLKTTCDGNGKWSAKIITKEAGGPHTLTVISIGQRIHLKNILLGDVYLCSGQSNMEWGGNQNLPEIINELPIANNPNIRLLQITKLGAHHPQDNIQDKWQTLSAESLKPFSAIGYFIAKKLNETTNIPIGIINSSWGGTGAEVWTPKKIIESDNELLTNSQAIGPHQWRPHEPGVLWNQMIFPIKTFNLKGFFWYQGESNVGTWSGYDKLMKSLVNSWREAWQEQIPFYFVQIAPFDYNNKLPLAALLREQQSKTAIELPKASMVVVTDLVNNIKDIHPTQKKEVANRLALLALKDIYQATAKDIASPIYKTHNINKNKIEIDFHHLEGSLVVKGSEITDLFIAGENKEFYKAKGEIKQNKLIVSAKEVPKPIAVRFGFTETAMPNLFNENGIPVSPFRTDNWAF